jgi:hypothetical protein
MVAMVDRTARDRLAAAIEEFLSDGIGAFEFDDCRRSRARSGP